MPTQVIWNQRVKRRGERLRQNDILVAMGLWYYGQFAPPPPLDSIAVPLFTNSETAAVTPLRRV